MLLNTQNTTGQDCPSYAAIFAEYMQTRFAPQFAVLIREAICAQNSGTTEGFQVQIKALTDMVEGLVDVDGLQEKIAQIRQMLDSDENGVNDLVELRQFFVTLENRVNENIEAGNTRSQLIINLQQTFNTFISQIQNRVEALERLVSTNTENISTNRQLIGTVETRVSEIANQIPDVSNFITTAQATDLVNQGRCSDRALMAGALESAFDSMLSIIKVELAKGCEQEAAPESGDDAPPASNDDAPPASEEREFTTNEDSDAPPAS